MALEHLLCQPGDGWAAKFGCFILWLLYTRKHVVPGMSRTHGMNSCWHGLQNLSACTGFRNVSMVGHCRWFDALATCCCLLRHPSIVTSHCIYSYSCGKYRWHTESLLATVDANCVTGWLRQQLPPGCVLCVSCRLLNICSLA